MTILELLDEYRILIRRYRTRPRDENADVLAAARLHMSEIAAELLRRNPTVHVDSMIGNVEAICQGKLVSLEPETAIVESGRDRYQGDPESLFPAWEHLEPSERRSQYEAAIQGIGEELQHVDEIRFVRSLAKVMHLDSEFIEHAAQSDAFDLAACLRRMSAIPAQLMDRRENSFAALCLSRIVAAKRGRGLLSLEESEAITCGLQGEHQPLKVRLQRVLAQPRSE